MSESAAIGMIGGADGPTAIFVSGNPITLIAVAVIVLIVIAFIIWKLFKR